MCSADFATAYQDEWTHPLSSGKAVASSAVTRASGTLHTKGKMRNPRRATSGPAEVTASCMNAPTLASKTFQSARYD